MSGEKITKMSGYLEKRGKLSIMGRWKKWWCVLEGQLLLYYKSRIEYANLSPCCGSLNMAFVKNVQPNRTKNKEKQQQWFHALVGVLPQNSYLAPILYFATNSIEYRRKSERKKKKSKHKVFAKSTKVTEHDESSLFAKSDNNFSNPAAVNESHFSIVENHTTEIQNISASQEKIEFCSTKISTSLECNLQLQDQCNRNSIKCSSEVNIRRYSSYHSVINGLSVSEKIANRRSISCECIFTERRTSSVEQCNFLSSGSSRSVDGSQQNNQYSDDTNEVRKHRRSRRKRKNDSKKYNTLSRKSLSFLKKIFKRKLENQNENEESTSSQDMIDKKGDSGSTTQVDPEVITISESSVLKLEEIKTIQLSMTETTENDETAQDELEETSPCNNFVDQNSTHTSSNNETDSDLSDTESGIVAIENFQKDEQLPDLPLKNGRRSSYVYHSFKDINSNYPAKITSQNNTETKELISMDNSASIELDSLLLQLSVLNNQCDKSHESLEFHNNFIEDPDYDIPRPHTSLMSDIGSISNVNEKPNLDFPLNRGISAQKYDSLRNDMAPDSLEMPWLSNDTKCSINYWSTKKEFDLNLENDSGSEYDYHDSLNSNKYNT